MKIIEVKNRISELINCLLEVWEGSVKATHLFLSDREIKNIKEYVPQALKSVEHLVIAEDEAGCPKAFMGIEDGSLEMLFVAPEERGKGLGKRLLRYGIENYAVAGIRDRINDYIRVYNRLHYPMTDGYINSGVMLINLRKWRDDNFFNKARMMAKKNPRVLMNHDQDLINMIYHGQIKMLSFKYNLLEYYLYTEDWLYMDRKYYQEIIEACNTPAIIHFCMPQKPWHYECINPYKELYYKYRAMTPWPELKLTHKVQHLSKKQKLKLVLERMGLYKVERKTTLRKDINIIEEPKNILF